MRLSWLLQFALFIVLQPLPAFAWKLVKMTADSRVRFQDGFKQMDLKIGDELPRQGYLLLGSKSRALFAEGASQIWIGANSIINVSKLKNQTEIKINYGQLRVQIEKEEAGKYHFSTKTAVAGVRGTEFFLQAQGPQQNICVIEGQVDAEVSKSDPDVRAATATSSDFLNFQVPAGFGVSKSSEGLWIKAPNQAKNVLRWMDETSVDKQSGYFQAYASSKSGSRADLFYCANQEDKFRDCFRGHIYPHFEGQLGAFEYRIRPRLSWVASSLNEPLDNDPLLSSYQRATLAPADINFGFDRSFGRLRGGYFQVDSLEPLLLSYGRFSTRPQTHLGTQFSTMDDRLKVTLTKGQPSSYALDGHSPLSLHLLEVRNLVAGQIAEVSAYLIHFDSPLESDQFAGLIGEARNGTFEVSGSLAASKNDNLFRIFLGQYLTAFWRISYQLQRAGPQLASPATASYQMGHYFTGSFSNIEQHWLMLDHRFNEDLSSQFGFIRSHQNSTTGRRIWNPGNEQWIADEAFFSTQWTLNSGGFIKAVAYYVTPHGLAASAAQITGLQFFTGLDF